MQELVKQIIKLICDQKIKVKEEFINQVIIEFIHNDFNIDYDNIDVNNIYDVLNEITTDEETIRSKVANILALKNLIMVDKLYHNENTINKIH